MGKKRGARKNSPTEKKALWNIERAKPVKSFRKIQAVNPYSGVMYFA
mgnify:CR=1 FL=1